MTEELAATEGLAMVGFAWKDLERYETVKRAANRADRTPVVDPRTEYLKARFGENVYDEGASVFVERSGGMLYSPGDYTRSKHKAGTLAYSEWSTTDGVTDTTHLDDGTTAVDLRTNPEDYVLQLDYFRFKNLPDINPPSGSTYIRAQTEPFNDEMKISEDRMIHWLQRFGVNQENDHHPIQLHASGHASGIEIQKMINQIKPKILIPIQTNNPGAFENPSGEVIAPTTGKHITILQLFAIRSLSYSSHCD